VKQLFSLKQLLIIVSNILVEYFPNNNQRINRLASHVNDYQNQPCPLHIKVFFLNSLLRTLYVDREKVFFHRKVPSKWKILLATTKTYAQMPNSGGILVGAR